MPQHAVFGIEPDKFKQIRQEDFACGCTSARILVYGASLTAGYPHYEPYAKALVAVCAAAGLDISVVGCGLCGFTARDMLQLCKSGFAADTCGRTGMGLQKLLEDESSDEGPFDLLILMAGTNDILEESRGADEIVDDIKRLHAACHERHTPTVAMSVPDFWRESDHRQRKVWVEVNDQLRRWAETSGLAHFCDSSQLLPYSEITKAKGAWEIDGVHFSETGSIMFGAALAKRVLAILSANEKVHDLTDEWCIDVAKKALQSSMQDVEASAHTDPCGTLGCANPSSAVRSLLVLGSSVALGSGATAGQCWVDRLTAEAASHEFKLHNEATNTATAHDVQEQLCDLPDGYLDSFSMVLVSLSFDNEGLASCSTKAEVEAVEAQFIEKLQMICMILRGLASPEVRLIFAGPYPSNDYGEIHLPSLLRTLEAIRAFEDVDQVIDFLQPTVHDGKGNWVTGLANDAVHPNNAGHEEMFKCIDVPRVLGLSCRTDG